MKSDAITRVTANPSLTVLGRALRGPMEPPVTTLRASGFPAWSTTRDLLRDSQQLVPPGLASPCARGSAASSPSPERRSLRVELHVSSRTSCEYWCTSRRPEAFASRDNVRSSDGALPDVEADLPRVHCPEGCVPERRRCAAPMTTSTNRSAEIALSPSTVASQKAGGARLAAERS